MVLVQVCCPECGISNPLDIYHLVQDQRMLCRRCDQRINLTFTGKTPRQIMEHLKDDLQTALPEHLKIIIR